VRIGRQAYAPNGGLAEVRKTMDTLGA